MKRSGLGILAGAIVVAGNCWAQEPAVHTATGLRGACAAAPDLGGFTIRSARINDPFWMLRWRRPSPDILTAVEELRGKSYAFDTVNAVSQKIESKAWLPDMPDDRAAISYSDIVLENCEGQQLDVVFDIFSAGISPTLSTVFEWRSREKAPNEAAGVVRTNAAFQFAPEVSFDQAQRATAGGRAQATWTKSQAPFGAVEIAGRGSSAAHALRLSLTGQHDSATAWLGHADWRLALQDSSVPVDNALMDDRRLGFQFSGTSKPQKGVVLRFGGVLEGGLLQSGFLAAELPSNTVADSHFTSSRLYGGITARGHHHAFEASYGLVLGSTGNSFHGDWRKHIGDIAHEFWLPFSDHRLFEVEQRLTVGRLQALGAVPAAERFFGGANEVPLVLGDNWRIRANPVVRSIPANGYSRTDAGAGGDRFFSYNSTTAFTVWGRPIVPRELLDDESFRRKLNGAIVSQRSLLDVVYQSNDQNFRAIKDGLPNVVAKLDQIGTAKDAARAAASTVPAADFEPCEDALRSSSSAAKKGVAGKRPQAFGWVKEMLPDGDFALIAVVSACGVDLVTTLKGAAVATADLESASADLSQLSAAIVKSFNAIDTKRAGDRAAADVRYTERALGVITREMNVTSISPVFVFDVARIGPGGGSSDSGNRYAIGGGIRFTLVSTVSITATYAANPRKRPGERSGAFVFSLTTRNLFE